MKFFFHKRAAALAAAFLLFVAAAIPQTIRPDFNRTQDFDVQHYVLRTSFDPAKRIVFGDTTVKLKALVTGLSTVELDAEALRIDSVVSESSNSPLAYKVGSGKLIVTLDKKYAPGDDISIRVKHSSTPKKGVYFVDEKREKGQLAHPAQIWTQGEPDEARHWFPLFDFPSDKATTEQFITVPRSQTVISNGKLLSKSDNANGTSTFHYSMDVPHATYLISFVVGEYVKIEEKYKDIPLGYYVYPGRERIVPLAYGKTKEMMGIFEELTGVPYPYNKYDQTIVANFTFGGMENITATTMADSEIFYAGVEFLRGGVEDLVAHELAHSWFGNLVTCRNWAELWLNEGFATFMEAAVREKMYGRKDYIRKIRLDAENFMIDDAVGKKRFGLFNQEAGNVSALFDRPAITYNKGGAVVHQLREQVGNDAFWKAVNIYLNRHKDGSVETSDLQKAMEEVSGQQLGWFFEQWVYENPANCSAGFSPLRRPDVCL
jgi:aminopeptidase N